MSKQTKRYLVENHGASQATLKTAFEGAITLAQNQGVSNITLVVPNKTDFRDSEAGKFLGEATAKALEKGEAPKLSPKCSLHLESVAKFPMHQVRDFVLSVHIGLKDQYEIDAGHVALVVHVPWSEIEGKEWQATWQPIVWGADTWKTPPFSVNAQLHAALQNLTKSINPSSGLSHESDRKQAKTVVSTAVANGLRFGDKDLFRWALQQDWPFDGAEDLEKIGVQARRK